MRLPDLRSRLRALPVVTIAPPDEALLKAVLVKHFTDRQLAVEPHVIGYIALHMEQSMEAAAAIVAEIDRAAMASHRKVTRALAAEVLARQPAAGSATAASPRHQTFILLLHDRAASACRQWQNCHSTHCSGCTPGHS